MTPTDADLDALDRQAAEAMGWTFREIVNRQPPHVEYLQWIDPRGMYHCSPPSPTRDHGDCLWLLLWTAWKLPTICFSIAVGNRKLWVGERTIRTEGAVAGEECVAITRVCIAALAAVGGHGEETGK